MRRTRNNGITEGFHNKMALINRQLTAFVSLCLARQGFGVCPHCWRRAGVCPPLLAESRNWSGRRDLNPGPLAPQASALARLRHGPNPSILAQRVAFAHNFPVLDTRLPGGSAHRDWIEAIEGRAKVIAPTRVGQEAAISLHMATVSLPTNRKVISDNQARKDHFAKLPSEHIRAPTAIS
jgi:hypothetical protein